MEVEVCTTAGEQDYGHHKQKIIKKLLPRASETWFGTFI